MNNFLAGVGCVFVIYLSLRLTEHLPTIFFVFLFALESYIVGCVFWGDIG